MKQPNHYPSRPQDLRFKVCTQRNFTHSMNVSRMKFWSLFQECQSRMSVNDVLNERNQIFWSNRGASSAFCYYPHELGRVVVTHRSHTGKSIIVLLYVIPTLDTTKFRNLTFANNRGMCSYRYVLVFLHRMRRTTLISSRVDTRKPAQTVM